MRASARVPCQQTDMRTSINRFAPLIVDSFLYSYSVKTNNTNWRFKVENENHASYKITRLIRRMCPLNWLLVLLLLLAISRLMVYSCLRVQSELRDMSIISAAPDIWMLDDVRVDDPGNTKRIRICKISMLDMFRVILCRHVCIKLTYKNILVFNLYTYSYIHSGEALWRGAGRVLHVHEGAATTIVPSLQSWIRP